MAGRIGKNIGLFSAMALLASQVSSPLYSDEFKTIEERCQVYVEIQDTVILQRELEHLLETAPDDQCIGFLVELLGGSPLASTDPAQNDPY